MYIIFKLMQIMIIIFPDRKRDAATAHQIHNCPIYDEIPVSKIDAVCGKAETSNSKLIPVYEEVQAKKDGISNINKYTQCEAYAMVEKPSPIDFQPGVKCNEYEAINPVHEATEKGEESVYHFSKCSAYGNRQTL